MLRVRYAFRDDNKTVAMLTQGTGVTYPSYQILALRKREIVPEFLDEYMAIDVKNNYISSSLLTDIGAQCVLTSFYKKCLIKVHSQIEFVIRPRILQQIAGYFPAFTSSALSEFFGDQPYGFLILLQVYCLSSEIPDRLMVKGRNGSAQVIRLYDEYGDWTYYEVHEDPTPLIDPGVYDYLVDELVHVIRLQNALIGIYGCDDESKILLQQKHDAYVANAGKYKRIFNEDDDVDRAFLDYEDIYRQVVDIDPSLKNYVNCIREIKPPQFVEWQALLPKAKAGDNVARDRITEMYLRNVLRISLYFSQRYELPIADMIQEGTIGLLMAIDKFDLDDMESFQTYYPLYVRQSIQRSMPNFAYSRYFPAHISDEMLRIRDYVSSIGYVLPDDIDMISSNIDTISSKVNMPPKKVKRLLSYFVPTISLDELYEKEQDTDLVSDFELVTNDFVDNALSSIGYMNLQKAILYVISTLTKREQIAIRLRFGFEDNNPKTLEDVGVALGVTRERARQIISKGLRRLRHPSRSRILRKFLDLDYQHINCE